MKYLIILLLSCSASAAEVCLNPDLTCDESIIIEGFVTTVCRTPLVIPDAPVVIVATIRIRIGPPLFREDNSAILPGELAGYEIVFDGMSEMIGPGVTIWDTPEIKPGSTLKIRVYDQWGNNSRYTDVILPGA